MLTKFEKTIVDYSKTVDIFTAATVAVALGYDTHVPYANIMNLWKKGLIAKIMDQANWVYTRMPSVLRCPVCGGLPRVTIGGDMAVAVCSSHMEVRSVPDELRADWNRKVIDWQIKFNEESK